ncbi:uncharacterized protein LOC135963162 isoform X2 [Calliphora vicina]
MSSSSGNESDNESLSVWNLRKHDNEVANNHILEIKCSNSITSKKRNGEKRLPTRRPDPNVYNRNALLARENRRKKKVYLETIEKELQDARTANHALVKALKRQQKIAQRLEQEKKYFEGLFANRSELLTLVNALNFRRNPESESNKSPFSTSSNNDDYIQNGMRGVMSLSSSINDADVLSVQFDSPSDDLENGTDSSLPSTSTSWDDIWGENGFHIDNLTLPESALIQSKNGIQNINGDQCYMSSSTLGCIQTPKQKSETSDFIDVEGECSNIGIFGSSSNWNQACRTPPLQLLSDQSSS